MARNAEKKNIMPIPTAFLSQKEDQVSIAVQIPVDRTIFPKIDSFSISNKIQTWDFYNLYNQPL